MSENTKIVKRYIKGYNSNDRQIIESLLDNNVVLHTSVGGIIDRKEILKWYSYEMAISEKIIVLKLSTEGNKVIVNQRYPDEIQRKLDFPAVEDIRTYFIENGLIKEIFTDSIIGESNLTAQRKIKWDGFFKWANTTCPEKLEDILGDVLNRGPEYVRLINEYVDSKK